MGSGLDSDLERQALPHLRLWTEANLWGKGDQAFLRWDFTCPTRDGSLGKRGCIFCGEQGSGDFAGSHTLSLQEQIKQRRELLKRKWPQGKYLAYFQNFTNNYGPVERLDQLYGEALQADDLVGLAIATRPDCIGSPVMEKSPRATS